MTPGLIVPSLPTSFPRRPRPLGVWGLLEAWAEPADAQVAADDPRNVPLRQEDDVHAGGVPLGRPVVRLDHHMGRVGARPAQTPATSNNSA